MPPADAKPKRYAFPKAERICSRLLFQQLVRTPAPRFRFPIKCYHLSRPVDGEKKPHAIAIAVPKKAHKRAVDRNRVKRLIRESWRLHHQELLSRRDCHFDLLFVYVAPVVLAYPEIEKSMKELLQWLNKQTPNHETD